MAKIKKVNTEEALFTDIARLIDESKSYVAYTVNANLLFCTGRLANASMMKF